jgi:16S rRNA processing protein RimM
VDHPEKPKNWTCVGVILGAHGIAGGLIIKSFCEVPKSIERYNPLKVENHFEALTFKIVGNIKGALQATTTKIKDRDSAIKLKGKLLFAERNKLPTIDEDEYYYTDLEGLTVKDTNEITIGRIKNVENHGAGTFLEIVFNEEVKTILVPFNKNTVPTISITEKYIILKES